MLFADDTLIYISGENLRHCENLLNEELHNLYEWLNMNKLKLNVNKSKAMLINNTNQLNVRVNNEIIDSEEEVKYLGVIVDRQLNFKKHIGKICAKIAKKINFINRIRHNVDDETVKNIYNTIVLPHFDYCSSVLFMCNEQSIADLQKLQSRAMRIILKCNRLTSRQFMLNKLKWMSVRQRINYNAFVFIYKIKNNLMPTYLTRKLTYVHAEQPYSLRNRGNFRIPSVRRVANEKQVLSKGLRMYNNLPACMKNSTNINNFKKLCIVYVKENFGL